MRKSESVCACVCVLVGGLKGGNREPIPQNIHILHIAKTVAGWTERFFKIRSGGGGMMQEGWLDGIALLQNK